MDSPKALAELQPTGAMQPQCGATAAPRPSLKNTLCCRAQPMVFPQHWLSYNQLGPCSRILMLWPCNTNITDWHTVLQGSSKGIPPALAELRQVVATQLQPPSDFQQELASQAEEGGLITSGDWSEGSNKWTAAWSAICQVPAVARLCIPFASSSCPFPCLCLRASAL